MKAISLIKLLTLVCFLVVGANIKAEDYKNKEECLRKTTGSCTEAEINEYITTTKTIVNGATQESSSISKGEARKQCENKKKEDACQKYESTSESKESKEECKQTYKDYIEAQKNTAKECLLVGEKSNEECRIKADKCANDLNSFGSPKEDSDNAADSIVKILGVYEQMQGVASGNPNTGNSVSGYCAMEKDEKAKEAEQTIDDKITRLREEIQDLKEKSTEADNKFNEKKQEVEKEMLDIEKEADKAKFEKQTKTQEDAARMQKAVMASEKKRKDNLVKIADLQVELANFSFAHQKINLALSDARITKECRDKAKATLEAKVKGTIDPKTGRQVKPTFTQQESIQFKKDLKFEESNCLQERALQKQETIKGLIDSKRKVQVQIDNLKTSNDDEAKAIENEMKQMEALKAIAVEEEQKAIESKFKALGALNQSVVDMEKYTADKKKTYEEKTKAIEDQINKLLLDRQNVKAKFAEVSAKATESRDRASDFLMKCCASSDPKANDANCGKVKTSNPDAERPSTRKSTSGTAK